MGPATSAEEILFEIVESGRLVFFTGAGSSADLVNQDRQRFPSWTTLLQTVLAERQKKGKYPDNPYLDKFLAEDADGQSLIEAASILREGFKKDFDKIVARQLTPALKQPTDKLNLHRLKQSLMLDLHPRGIVTVNVDSLHENYLKQQKLQKKWNFADPLQPGGDSELRKVLTEIDHKPFLVKAHGTCGKVIAFDFQTYRRLLAESPIYQMFMINLFTNFQIVFLGFGLSDLDFDFFLQSQALTFGEPIRTHLALVKRKPRDKTAQRRAALLSKRFGVQYLWYKEHSDIPGILERAGTTPGARLRSILESCLDPRSKVRSKAHFDLTNLGPAGKHVAVLAIEKAIRKMLPGTKANWFKLSEYVYALGKIDPPLLADRQRCRAALLESLRTTRIKEVAAHAILALEKLAEREDVQSLQELLNRSFWEKLIDLPKAPDPENRVPVYLESLILRLKAKPRAKPK